MYVIIIIASHHDKIRLKDDFNIEEQIGFCASILCILHPVLVIQGKVDIFDWSKLDSTDNGAAIIPQVPGQIILRKDIGIKLIVAGKYFPLVRKGKGGVNRVARAIVIFIEVVISCQVVFGTYLILKPIAQKSRKDHLMHLLSMNGVIASNNKVFCGIQGKIRHPAFIHCQIEDLYILLHYS